MSLGEKIPLLFTLWLLIIVWCDFKSRKVYNLWVVLGLFGWFLGVIYYKSSMHEGLISVLVAVAVLLPFYAVGWMGAGDVKFGIVVGAWFGLSSGLVVVWLGGSFLAGVHAICLLLWTPLKRMPMVQGVLVGLGLGGYLMTGRERAKGRLFSSASIRRLNGVSLPYAGYMAIAAICFLWRQYI